MSFLYAIREGLAGFRRARMAVFASTSALTVALVIIGMFLLLGIQVQQVSAWLQQRVGEMEVFLGDLEQEEARELQRRVESLPGVARVQYISQEEAEEIFRQEFGEGADIFTEGSFLPTSLRVRVGPAYASPDSLSQLAARIRGWNQVEDVVFNQPLLVKVQQNLRLITAVGLVLTGLIVLACLFLVSNTIRLTIYARRLLIRTMKLVGATDRFVRRPFLVEGIVQGVLAGVLSVGVVWVGYQLLLRYLPQLEVAEWPGGTPLVVLSVLIPLGILLGFAGSRMAVRKFLEDIAIR